MFRRRHHPPPDPLVPVVLELAAVNADQQREITRLQRLVNDWEATWNHAQARWLRAEAEAERLASVAMADAITQLNDDER